MDRRFARRVCNDKTVANGGAMFDLEQGANVADAYRAIRGGTGARFQEPLPGLDRRERRHGPGLRVLGVPRNRQQGKHGNRLHNHAPMSAAGAFRRSVPSSHCCHVRIGCFGQGSMRPKHGRNKLTQ